MPFGAFGGQFREGQWRSLRRFMLEERRDASKREAVILSELRRIGWVRIIYDQIRDPNDNTKILKTTEKRIGLELTPNSSLEKLVSAYVLMGGNPYDISMFLSPDDALPTTPSGKSTQPGGGVVTRLDHEYDYSKGLEAGQSSVDKFSATRTGGNRVLPDDVINEALSRGRGWISKEIRHKRNAIENRIIKLCDLREQLLTELVDLTWATAGEGINSRVYDSSLYEDSMTAAAVAARIDALFRIPQPDGRVPAIPTSNETEAPGNLNQEALGAFANLTSEDPETSGNNAC